MRGSPIFLKYREIYVVNVMKSNIMEICFFDSWSGVKSTVFCKVLSCATLLECSTLKYCGTREQCYWKEFFSCLFDAQSSYMRFNGSLAVRFLKWIDVGKHCLAVCKCMTSIDH